MTPAPHKVISTTLLLGAMAGASWAGAQTVVEHRRPHRLRTHLTIELAASNGNAAKTLTVAQSPLTVQGLYPGDAPIPVGVAVTNPNSGDVSITSLQATVSAVDKPGCPAGTVTVNQLPAGAFPFKVKSGQTVSQSLTLQMGRTAPEACRGATFTITYTATGSGAS